MSETCSKCGEHLEDKWAFCPHCAAPVRHEAHLPPQPEHEPAPVKGAFGGVLLGLIAAPPLIICGSMICLLGPAAVFGIPLIIAGICAPVLVPYLTINAARGKCPWCGTAIACVTPINVFYCHACSKRIVVEKRALLRAG